VLRPNRAAYGRQHRRYDDAMRHRAHHYVAGEKRNGTIGVPTNVVHADLKPSDQLHTRHRLGNARSGRGFHWNSANAPPCGGGICSTFVTDRCFFVIAHMLTGSVARSTGCVSISDRVSGSNSQTMAKPNMAISARPQKAAAAPK